MAGLFGDQTKRGGGLLGSVISGDKTATTGLMALPEPQKAGLFDYALAALAGGGLSGAAALGLQQRQQRRSYDANGQKLAGLNTQGEAAGWTPAERLAFSVDPAKALDMIAERNKPRETAGGNSVLMNGKFLTAPKLGMDGGYGYNQTADGTTWQAQRGINHQELETERHNTGTEDQARDALAETSRSNRADESLGLGQLGVARGQLGVSQGNLALARETKVPGGKATEAQATAGFNAARIVNAEKTLTGLERGGYDASLGAMGGSLASPLGGIEKAQSYAQAQNEWADSLLRLTTGAAATKEEVALAKKTYFPALGDTPAVRQQKAAARQQVMSEAVKRSGPAAPTAHTGSADPLGIR